MRWNSPRYATEVQSLATIPLAPTPIHINLRRRPSFTPMPILYAWLQEKLLKELKLSRHIQPIQHQALIGMWPLPDCLCTVLNTLFGIHRVLDCNPMNLPLPATEYYTRDTKDACFGAGYNTDTPWQGTSLSIPEHKAQNLTKALEQALYSAHPHRCTAPSFTILLLPAWQHTPYLARNLHTRHIQKITSIPLHPPSELASTKTYNINIYLVANPKALSIINVTQVVTQLAAGIREIYNTTPDHISIHTDRQDPKTLDCSKKYDEAPPPPPPLPHNLPPLKLYIHKPRWDPNAFIYTDGSLVIGNPTLGGAIIDPIQSTTTCIKVYSQDERHTISRGELAAIARAITLHKSSPSLHILTDSSFCMKLCPRSTYLHPTPPSRTT